MKGSAYNSTSITEVFLKSSYHSANSQSKAPESVKVGPISHWVSGQEEKTDTKLIAGLPTVDGIDIRNVDYK